MTEQEFNTAQLAAQQSKKDLTVKPATPEASPATVTLEGLSRELDLYRPFLERLRTGSVIGKLTISGTQSVSSLAKILLDTKAFQSGSLTVDVTNHKISVHQQGTYLITGCVTFSSGTALKTYQAFLYANGAAVANTSAAPGFSGSIVGLPLTATLELTGGDYLELYAQASAAGNVGGLTFLSIIKL
jgi:hypothetical protein